MPSVEALRVSDAQCLAAFDAYQKSLINVVQSPGSIHIIDEGAPVGMRELAKFKVEDVDKATIAFQIIYMRQILEAALNVN